MDEKVKKQKVYSLSKSIKRDELAVQIAHEHQLTAQKAKIIIRTFCDTVAKEINQGNSVYIPKIGLLGHIIKNGGKTRNPNTGKQVSVSRKAYPKIKWAHSIKMNLKKLNLKEVSHGTESESK